jgi:hypothetical protein
MIFVVTVVSIEELSTIITILLAHIHVIGSVYSRIGSGKGSSPEAIHRCNASFGKKSSSIQVDEQAEEID